MTHTKLVSMAVGSLRRGAQRTGLRQRRDAGRHRLEARVPFGAGGEQSFTRGFPRRSRQALPPEAGAGRWLRALLPVATWPDRGRGTALGLGLARSERARN